MKRGLVRLSLGLLAPYLVLSYNAAGCGAESRPPEVAFGGQPSVDIETEESRGGARTWTNDPQADGENNPAAGDPIPTEPCPSLVDYAAAYKCGAGQHVAQLRKAKVLLVVDKSGSMDNAPAEFNQTTKWEALKQALATAMPAAQEQISFGLQLFPERTVTEECGDSCCTMPDEASGVDVPIAEGPEAVASVLRVLDESQPGGGTPTAAALRRAHSYFATGEGQMLEGEKYVLLATDGGPNCNSELVCDQEHCVFNMEGNQALCDLSTNCCEGSDYLRQGCLDDQAVLDEIQNLARSNVKTIVVGIPGSEPFRAPLNRFAEEGGMPNPHSEEDKYYAVAAESGTAGLTKTLRDITVDLVRDCVVELPQEPQDPRKLQIAVDCRIITLSTEDSDGTWSNEGRLIKLEGWICDRIKEQGADRIDYLVGCGTVR